MRIFKPDFTDRVAIEGIPGLVLRPVSIDQRKTGFDTLRTFRVYHFQEGVPVDGHAEEDEVLVVVLSGSIELTLSGGEQKIGPVGMEAPHSSSPCVAYLPPGGEYRLVPLASSDVAYVRARPQSLRRPVAVFPRIAPKQLEQVNEIFEETTYAELLQVRILKVSPASGTARFTPLRNSDAGVEALIHVVGLQGGETGIASQPNTEGLVIGSGDTLAIRGEENPTLEFPQGSSPLVVVFTEKR